MEPLSDKISRLRADLRQLLDAPHPPQHDINQLQNRVADVLLRALSDEEHSVVELLSTLKQRVEGEQAGTLYRDIVPADDQRMRPQSEPRRHLFMPHPGASDSEARRLWPLQLLLQIASRSPRHRGSLAEQLGLHVEAMSRAADEAANASSVATWSHHQYLHYLIEALLFLNAAEPPPFRLNGRNFHDAGGKTVRLSDQQAKFLQILVDRVGQVVPYATFREAGIFYAPQVKDRLLRRLRSAGIELTITSQPGAYLLPVRS